MVCALPSYAYLPGHTPRHPEGGFDALRETARAGMGIAELSICDSWTTGWVFLRHGFFWEAHEVWEPVWNVLPPNSQERHMVQAAIQIANAALKQRMGRPRAADRLCGLAAEHLRQCRSSASVMGIAIADMDRWLGRIGRREICNIMQIIE